MNEKTLKTDSWVPRVRLLIGILIPLVYFPLMVRLLGQEDYGLHSMADSVIECLLLLTLCMGGAFSRLLEQRRAESDPEGVRRIFGLYVKTFAVVALIILAAGLYISFHLGGFRRSLGEEELEMLKKICLLMTVDAAVFLPLGAWRAVIDTHDGSGFLQLIDLGIAVLTPCAGLAVLLLGWASIGLVSVSIGVHLIVFILYILYVRKKAGVSPSLGRAGSGHLRQVMRSSVFPLLDLCAEVLFLPADRLIVGWMMGSHSAALYSAGASVSVYLAGLCAMAGARLTPLPDGWPERDQPEGSYDMLFIRYGRRQFILFFFIFSAFAVFGRHFLSLWAGSAYVRSYGVVLFTLAAMGIPLLQEAGTVLLHPFGRHRFHAVVFLCTAAVSVLLTLLLIKPWGVLGAAAATFVTYAAGGVVMNVFCYRSIGLDVNLFWKRIARMCPVMVPFGAVCWFAVNAIRATSWPLLIALAVVYTVLYFLLTRRFMMNARERDVTAAPFRKAWNRIAWRAG